MQEHILDTIGNTPLIPLQKMHNYPCEIYVKLENKNPGASIKDRIALHMIRKAMEQGSLAQGGTIIEPTSGNTGIALAMIAAVYGFRCFIAMPESMSIERQKLIRSYGAELILTPASKGMAGAAQAAQELLEKTPHAFMPNQFANAHAVEAHYTTTGPEIHKAFAQKELMPDVLVAGVGTGTTLSGCALYLREVYPSLRVCAVEPAESPLLSQGQSGPHGIQGIGANFIPQALRREVVDTVLTVSTKDAISTAQKLQKFEGISGGISSGANVCAALQLAAQKDMQGKRIVTFICDTGERYLSTALFDK